MCISRSNSFSSAPIASSDTMQGYRNSYFLFTQLKTDSADGIDLSLSGSISGSISKESTSMVVITICPGLIMTGLDVELTKSNSVEQDLKSFFFKYFLSSHKEGLSLHGGMRLRGTLRPLNKLALLQSPHAYSVPL